MTAALKAKIEEIVSKLQQRGVPLRKPASRLSLMRLEDALSAPLSAEAVAVYSVFDGFEMGMADDRTMISLWPTDAICDSVRAGDMTDEGQPIGDHFFSADIFRCDLRDGASKVWLTERGSVVADNLIEFCRHVADATFEP